MRVIKKQISSLLAHLGYRVSRLENFRSVEDFARIGRGLQMYTLYGGADFQEFLTLVQHSKSELFQDIFAFSALGRKRNGFFVEFGATDGLIGSNTWTLEKKFGWTGVLAEPARCWHSALRKNRSANVETRCVWSKSGERLSFVEEVTPSYSRIADRAGFFVGKWLGSKKSTYPVESISLMDMLDQHAAPSVIDYLSIDTEGSEYEILKRVDFRSRRFNVITCEHNYIRENREKIYFHLMDQGYRRVLESVSFFDDWYVHSEALP
jgi:FkbM family methyltransferase